MLNIASIMGISRCSRSKVWLESKECTHHLQLWNILLGGSRYDLYVGGIPTMTSQHPCSEKSARMSPLSHSFSHLLVRCSLIALPIQRCLHVETSEPEVWNRGQDAFLLLGYFTSTHQATLPWPFLLLTINMVLQRKWKWNMHLKILLSGILHPQKWGHFAQKTWWVLSVF